MHILLHCENCTTSQYKQLSVPFVSLEVNSATKKKSTAVLLNSSHNSILNICIDPASIRDLFSKKTTEEALPGLMLKRSVCNVRITCVDVQELKKSTEII